MVAVIPAVCCPLPGVAVDVEEAPGVCLEAVDRNGGPSVEAAGAVIVGLLGCD